MKSALNRFVLIAWVRLASHRGAVVIILLFRSTPPSKLDSYSGQPPHNVNYCCSPSSRPLMHGSPTYSSPSNTPPTPADNTMPVRSLRGTATSRSLPESPDLSTARGAPDDSLAAQSSVGSQSAPLGKGGCWYVPHSFSIYHPHVAHRRLPGPVVSGERHVSYPPSAFFLRWLIDLLAAEM